MRAKISYGVIILVLILVLGGAIGFKLYKQAEIREYLDNRETPAVHLNATLAVADSWDQRLSAIGSLRSQRGIDISSEVDGVIRRLHITPGEQVQAGDLLVEMDDTVDRATLKSAKVRLEKTRRDFERDRTLFERALISEDQFENSRSEFDSAEALVEETRGIIDKKSIEAPFAGRVGIHNLAEGHYLGKGDPLVKLEALQSLFLDFHLPEKHLESVAPGQQVRFSVPSFGEQVFQAEVKYVDVYIQATTRNILVRSVVDNAEQHLLPGMFANVTLIMDQSRPVVTVPREAVAFSLYGETVYLLEPTGIDGTGNKPDQTGWKARRLSVKTGDVRNNQIVVEGVRAGQVIARDTQHRLLEGSPVIIENLDALPLDRMSLDKSPLDKLSMDSSALDVSTSDSSGVRDASPEVEQH